MEKVNLYSKIGLIIIGITSLLYAMFSRFFAQLYLDLPFLNFPIFIGEIMLGICLIILLLKWFSAPPKWNKWYFLLIFYVLWVLSQALIGYTSYGPLAFRNAALLYYPLFFVLGYEFFDKNYFDQKRIIGILLIMLIVNILRFAYENYYYFDATYCFLYLVLLINIKDKRLKILFSLLFIVFFSLQGFFITSKSNTLSVIVAVLFLMVCILFRWINIKWWQRILVFGVAGAGLLLMFTCLWNKTKIKSLISPNKLIAAYKANEEEIKNLEKDYKPRELKVNLYNKEDAKVFENSDIKFGHKKMINQDQILDEINVELKQVHEKHLKPQDNDTQLRFNIGGLFNDSIQKIDENPMAKQEVLEALEKEMVEKATSYLLKQRKEELGKETTANLSTIEEIDEKYIEDITKTYMNQFQNLLENEIVVDRRGVEVEQANALFRFYIWRDMFREMLAERALWGINWGKPQRSKTVEMLRIALGEWSRDGWITPHNSFLHMIYRGGFIGIILVALIFLSFINLVGVFLKYKSLTGVFLSAILLFWLFMSNFLVILEFPYNAIPFWSLFGMIWAYRQYILKEAKFSK